MKRIAIIADAWKRYVNYSWILGCKDYIQEQNLDVEIDIFQIFGNFNMDDKHNIGEYNIIELPDLKKYDGIILEITNTIMKDQYDRIVRKVIESDVPAVSLLETIPGLYSAVIDNYGSMREVVEHLIVRHGCRKINYVGGPASSYENKSRQRAYEDVLREYGIKLEQKRIFQQNYEVYTGINAFDHFNSSGMIPDAFVCANENIAVGLCQRAFEAGYRVPDDFCITGFDDFDKASYFEPRITTISYSRMDVAYQAMGVLHRIWNGENVQKIVYSKAKPVFQESCGCNNIKHKHRSDYIKERIFSEVRQIDLYNETMVMNRKLVECESYEKMGEQLVKCFDALRCKEMYLIMNRDIVNAQNCGVMDEIEEEQRVEGYPPEMEAVIAFKDGKIHTDVQMNVEDMVPKLWNRKKGDIRVFVPLHIREREIGYFVLVNCDYMFENQFLYEIIASFSKSLEYFYGKIELEKANQKLSILYIQDSFTGLYNRMAYNQLAIPLYNSCIDENKPLAIMFFDADHLKMVNDKYGHDMGNVVIEGVADAIKRSFPHEAVAMRYGGDEFVVLIPDCNEQKAKNMEKSFHKTLKDMTSAKKLPFGIEASSGFVIAVDNSRSLDDYINQADDLMYQAKKRHKAQRD